jgi:tetratricopeptide (TPR) repeat protein
MNRMLMTVALLGCAAATAHADDLIFLTGGRVYNGTVLESTWDWVKVRATVDGEQNDYTVDADEFEPHCFYVIRDKAIGDDAAERIKLAKYCVDNEMFSRAKVQMDRARAADPKVVEEFMQNEFPKIRDGLADKILAAGQRALRRGSTANAKKYASLILTKFEGTPAEAGAETLLDEVDKKIDEEHAKVRAQRRRSAVLSPVEKEMDAASRSNEKGLKARTIGQSKDPLEEAATRYVRAMKMAEDYAKQAPDEQTAAALQDMAKEAREGAVQAYLNLANGMAARSSYQEGVTYCNKALALDPTNAEVKQARLTISTTTGWNRRTGRR